MKEPVRKLFLDASFVIYLNTLIGPERRIIDDFFKDLLKERLFTNLLVLDETLYISKKRYGVAYGVSLSFLMRAVIPFTEIIPIAEEDLPAMEAQLSRHDIKPSDAIHLATMEKAGVSIIVSEDEEFDVVPNIKRIWPKT